MCVSWLPAALTGARESSCLSIVSLLHTTMSSSSSSLLLRAGVAALWCVGGAVGKLSSRTIDLCTSYTKVCDSLTSKVRPTTPPAVQEYGGPVASSLEWRGMLRKVSRIQIRCEAGQMAAAGSWVVLSLIM